MNQPLPYSTQFDPEDGGRMFLRKLVSTYETTGCTDQKTQTPVSRHDCFHETHSFVICKIDYCAP